MVRYYTPKPPVYEVMEFPRYQSKYAIDEFLEWGGFSSSRKRRGEKLWDLTGRKFNSDCYGVKPGDEFIRPAGDVGYTASRFYDFDAEKFQEVYEPNAAYTIED